MTIKLAVLQSGDQIISDVSEVVSEDKQPIAYLFKKPQRLKYNTPIFLSEENSAETSVEVTLSNWITVSEDDDVPVSINQVVALVNPIASVVKMYNEKVNGKPSN